MHTVEVLLFYSSCLVPLRFQRKLYHGDSGPRLRAMFGNTSSTPRLWHISSNRNSSGQTVHRQRPLSTSGKTHTYIMYGTVV
ncbi:hypothetical protein V5799_004323 [Amblyomma americanum]|uniref:Uncharacterized protein n=1 Tax=Amblyomma americanum TaxID=6943 RepID=A0AAQ4D6F5_AMBAM